MRLVPHLFVRVEQVFEEFALVHLQRGFDLLAAPVELSVVLVTAFQDVVHHRLLHLSVLINVNKAEIISAGAVLRLITLQ